MINPILDKKKCCACSACVQICKHNAIVMAEDEYGFVYPIIDQSLCVDCGLCEKVCPMNNNFTQTPIETFACAWKNNDIVNCASGGVFSCTASHIISQEGVAFGCILKNIEEKKIVQIESAHDFSKLQQMQGSKYVQADVKNTFQEAKRTLDNGTLVLYSGTPCQIAGLKNYLRRDYENLYTIDLICHGVPNAKIFQSYIAYLEKQKKQKIVDFKFRDKKKKWGIYCYHYCYNKGKTMKHSYKDYTRSIYYTLFLSSAIHRDSCYSCPFAKKERTGDITIGDCWGVEKEHPEWDSLNGGDIDFTKGVSCVLINTPKGKKLWELIKNDIIHHPMEFEKISKYNHQLLSPSRLHPHRTTYLEHFKKEGYKGLIKSYYFKEYKSIIKTFLMGIFTPIFKKQI